MKLHFKNVTVVSSAGEEVRDVFVEDGLIVSELTGEAERVVDGTGKYLMPGAIDAHVHFREPGAEHKETWETASAAAALGGVTSVMDMPNNSPAIVTAGNLKAKRELVAGRSYVNYGFHFGATGGNNAAILEAENITGVKVYMGSSTGDLLVEESELWRGVFEAAKEKGVPVVVHAEDNHRIKERMKEFAGDDSAVSHAHVRDCECAKLAASEAVKLRFEVGNKLHIAHMSTAAEVELMRDFACDELSCEVTMHHLFFHMDDMKDAFLKMNPPLREAEDVRVLWEALRDGTVNCLATDHAPHTLEEKSRGIWQAPAGVPGVQFMLPLMLNEVNQNMLPFSRLVEMMCEEPARIFNLEGKGALRVGMHADLVLVDMELEQTVSRDMVASKCGWSPYEGFTLKGWPVMTVVHGEIVAENGELQPKMAGEELVVKT